MTALSLPPEARAARRAEILAALARLGGNVAAVARERGVSRAHLLSGAGLTTEEVRALHPRRVRRAKKGRTS